MTDRDRLADALMGATAWELREDVRLVALFRQHGTPVPADTLDRLAALALAIAEMQEHGAFVDGGALAWDVSLGDNLGEPALDHPTLPAALASLLRQP